MNGLSPVTATLLHAVVAGQVSLIVSAVAIDVRRSVVGALALERGERGGGGRIEVLVEAGAGRRDDALRCAMGVGGGGGGRLCRDRGTRFEGGILDGVHAV